MEPAWYCARTKPKHEHIAAANIRKLLSLEVFHPTLLLEKNTRRGMVRTTEPLFPCYIFVRCVIQERLDSLRYINGVSTIVHFADRIPSVSDSVIAELRSWFDGDKPMLVEEKLLPGASVVVKEGAFEGMQASVLKVLSAGQRVQVLLDILGRQTTVEVDRRLVALENNKVADLVPPAVTSQQDRLLYV